MIRPFLLALLAAAGSLRAAPTAENTTSAPAPAYSLLYPDATPGIYGTFVMQLNAPTTFLLWAREGQAVNLSSVQVQAKKAPQPKLGMILLGPAGQPVELAERGSGGTRQFEFTAPSTGVYTLACDPMGQPVTVNSASAPFCLHADDGQFHFANVSGDLYFYVPPGAHEITAQTTSTGDNMVLGEVFDATGRLPKRGIAMPGGVHIHFSIPAATAGSVWSLRLPPTAHENGETTDVTLEGVPAILAASPEALMAAVESPIAPASPTTQDLPKPSPFPPPPPRHAPRVLLVGDSMVASYPNPPPERPTLTGWGQVLNKLMTPGTRIDNRARSGASARSFLERGWWVESLLQPLDYVLIHFGGNDVKWGERYGDAAGSYRDYLRAFIFTARARGIKPVLVTSVARRDFKDGKIVTTLRPYTTAMKEIAAELHVPLIDLHEASIDLWEKVGEKGCEMFCPGDNDHGHTSRFGAIQLALLVAQGLAVVTPELKEELLLEW